MKYVEPEMEVVELDEKVITTLSVGTEEGGIDGNITVIPGGGDM